MDRGGVVELGTFGGATGRASDVSHDGKKIVGWAVHPTLGSRAALWTEGFGIADLNSLYADCIPQGWRLVAATGISPDGRFIVGTGFNPEGKREAWHLDTVPEPITIVVMVGGLLILRLRR